MIAKLWLSSTHEAPDSYIGFRTLNEIQDFIRWNDHDSNPLTIKEVYLDYGICCVDFLMWLERNSRELPVRVNEHNRIISDTAKEIIKRNRWKEV